MESIYFKEIVGSLENSLLSCQGHILYIWEFSVNFMPFIQLFLISSRILSKTKSLRAKFASFYIETGGKTLVFFVAF